MTADFRKLKSGQPALVISLDHELYWGVRDMVSLDQYRANLLGSRREVIPRTLKLFRDYDIRATWATVGMLFHSSLEELQRTIPPPDLRPAYRNQKLSPYPAIEAGEIGSDEENDSFHFGRSLIRQIADTPGQEIASHTYCHYYCLEPGQTAPQFRADLERAVSVTKSFDPNLKPGSIVFPRNQLNPDYAAIIRELGFTTIRGNQPTWLYQARNQVDESRLRRSIRLADAYLNLSGHNSFRLGEVIQPDGLADVRASRFLRPWSRRFKSLEPLRKHRFLADLDAAARKGEIYHIWWHPHNMGVNTNENFALLEAILERCAALKKSHDMLSCHMADIAQSAREAPHAD